MKVLLIHPIFAGAPTQALIAFVKTEHTYECPEVIFAGPGLETERTSLLTCTRAVRHHRWAPAVPGLGG